MRHSSAVWFSGPLKLPRQPALIYSERLYPVLHTPGLQYTPVSCSLPPPKRIGSVAEVRALKARANRANRANRAVRGRISLRCCADVFPGCTQNTHVARKTRGSIGGSLQRGRISELPLSPLSLRAPTKSHCLANHWSNDRKENSITVDEEFGSDVWFSLKVTIQRYVRFW